MAEARGNAPVLALPVQGAMLADQRGGGRWMRATWHGEADVMVLSLWRDTGCVGTIRLERTQIAELVTALVDGLAEEPGGSARGGI